MVTTLTALPAWAALVAALVPLAVAALVALPGSRALGVRLAPVAALPALAAAALVPDGQSALAALVTGITVEVDPVSRTFLALAAAVWTAGALHAAADRGRQTYGPRFWGFFLLAMSGSLALSVTADAAGFYTFFALMALPTYALVAADRGAEPRRAGRIYLSYTVLGEALLVCGLFITGAAAFGLVLPVWATPAGVVLLLLAFGIKIGAIGLHGWMPVSYSAAPPAAAAVLSGAMSKAGVLGLLRFLPGGEPDAVAFGALVMAAGVASAFYGALVGVVQREPKTVLAYSSVSQLGLITIGIGAGLAVPEAWPAAVIGATAYAVHHGLAKAALFLGEDIAARSNSRAPALVGLALPALALAGLPLTSGAVAKVALKEATGLAPGSWHGALELLLPLAAVGTTLLMARFLFLVATRPETPAAGAEPSAKATPSPSVIRTAVTPLAAAPWALLLLAVAVTMWIWPAEEIRYAATKSLTGAYLWLAIWPIGAGAALAAGAWLARATTSRGSGAIPPADVFAPLFAWAHRVIDERDADVASTPAKPAAPVLPVPPPPTRGNAFLVRVGAVESGLLAWTTAISAIAAISVLLLVLASRL